jgi:hypothetical protein
MTYSELNSLSIEQLRSLNSKVVEVIKLKRKEVALEKKDELRIGMTVSVNHPKLAGKQLVVEKINRTKAVLKLLNGFGGYTVPLSMININA